MAKKEVIAPLGYQLVSEAAISWLYENHPEAYQGFYERIHQAAQQGVRPTGLDAPQKAESIAYYRVPKNKTLVDPPCG